MLAYYVEWRMRKALAPILFDDEQLSNSFLLIYQIKISKKRN